MRHKIPTPSTWPVVRITAPGGHRQELNWVDETTPTTRRKPDGVEAAEIFLKLGDPAPADAWRR
jgi:hypothetical protein